MARRGKLIDGAGSGATIINNYAVFMGYLSMGIKGLGFLILTWTTVVLLGGFVSTLQKKDFWCLTFITLVQTAGIFDIYLNEKLSYILHSAHGLLVGSISSILSYDDMEKAKNTGYGFVVYLMRLLLAIVCVVVQMLVLAIILCPLTTVYMSGLLISTGISLWRLIQHDHGGNSDEKANLKPAMDSLYCLALLQGVLFMYRFIFAHAGKRIAKNLIPTSGDDELEAVLTYLRKTTSGCEKDPSFARRRNFITHAVDLIGSKSPSDCLSGIQLLYTVICIGERRLKQGMELISPTCIQSADDCLSSVKHLYTCLCFEFRPRGRKEARVKGRKIIKEIIGERMLMKNLIMSASSSPVLQKVLLQALNLRDAYDRDMRNQAARIVAYLALDINLEQFPQGIQYISTLIGTFEEYCQPYQRKRLIRKYDQVWNPQASRLPSHVHSDKLWKAYEKLVLRGLCILQKLATYGNNCRIMSETQGLLPRIMAPLTSDLIHRFNGGTWSISVVEGSLKVIRLLVAAPGETGARMCREISNNKEAVRTMKRILGCDYCHVKLQKQAMGILIQLYMDTSRPAFIKILVDIFAAGNSTDRSIRKLVGKALAKLCFQSGSNTGIILQLDGDIVGSFTKILQNGDAENKTCRIRAAEILEHMCIHHTQEDECLSTLKKAMTSTMPKVFAQIFGHELRKDETHARPEPDQLEVLVKVDIENPSSTHPEYKVDEGDVNMEEDESENEEDEDEEFRAPLLSLCVTVCDTLSSADQDLACQFSAINLPNRLKWMVIRNRVATVHCLRLMKVTCKMVISMMKHHGNYIKEDLDSLMEALSIASEHMVHLDMSMVFAGQDNGATTMKPFRSLHSLVIEAKESVETRTATKAYKSENIMEPSTSGHPPMGDTN